eukprot:scaffold26663_cov22-Tisochrysis_lutea.AAC.1
MGVYWVHGRAQTMMNAIAGRVGAIRHRHEYHRAGASKQPEKEGHTQLMQRKNERFTHAITPCERRKDHKAVL